MARVVRNARIADPLEGAIGVRERAGVERQPGQEARDVPRGAAVGRARVADVAGAPVEEAPHLVSRDDRGAGGEGVGLDLRRMLARGVGEGIGADTRQRNVGGRGRRGRGKQHGGRNGCKPRRPRKRWTQHAQGVHPRPRSANRPKGQTGTDLAHTPSATCSWTRAGRGNPLARGLAVAEDAQRRTRRGRSARGTEIAPLGAVRTRVARTARVGYDIGRTFEARPEPRTRDLPPRPGGSSCRPACERPSPRRPPRTWSAWPRAPARARRRHP